MSEVITTLTGVDRAQAELNKRYALIKDFSEHARLSGKVTTAFEKAVQRASHAGEMRVDPALMSRSCNGLRGILVTVESHGIPLSSRLPLILAAVMHPKQFQFQDVVNADQPIHIYLVMRGTLAFVGTPHPKGGIAPYTVSEVQSALGLGRRPRAQTDEEDPEAIWVFRGLKLCRPEVHQHDLYPYKLFGVRSYLGEYEPFADLPSRVAFARVESELGAEVLVLHKKDLLELKGEFPGAAQIWIKMLEPAMMHDEDHRAPFQRRPETLRPSSELEVAETEDLTGGLYDDEICDMCMWAVEHIVSKCCVSGNLVHEISCDPHLPSCENNVTYSLLRRIAHAQAVKRNSCWTSSFTCRNPTFVLLIQALGVRPLKLTSALAAYEVCKMGVTETYDCVGDVDSGHIHRGKTQLQDLPNSDVKIQDHRKHTCKNVGLSTEDHWQECLYEDKRCLKTANTWKTMKMCEKIDLTMISDDELESFDEEEEEDAEPELGSADSRLRLKREQDEVVFQADDDLGFPELEIRWSPELNSWTAADGKFDKTNQECLRKLGEESNLTQFLGDGTSQKMVKDMCIFLYEVGDEPGAAGTWYLENVPTEVRGLLKTAYGGGSFTGFLFRTLLTVEDNLQNVGFGSGLVKKANKVTSKYDQKGVMAYETKDLEKKLHYIRHFVETYKVDLESVEGLQGCGNEDVAFLSEPVIMEWDLDSDEATHGAKDIFSVTSIVLCGACTIVVIAMFVAAERWVSVNMLLRHHLEDRVQASPLIEEDLRDVELPPPESSRRNSDATGTSGRAVFPDLWGACGLWGQRNNFDLGAPEHRRVAESEALRLTVEDLGDAELRHASMRCAHNCDVLDRLERLIVVPGRFRPEAPEDVETFSPTEVEGHGLAVTY
eukprot:s1169_g5.t4